MSVASDQIKEYLLAGGLFNPEMMNQTQHDAVRDTLIKAWDDIQKLEAENAALREDKARLDWLDKTGCWLTIPGARNFLSGASRAVIDAARKEAQP